MLTKLLAVELTSEVSAENSIAATRYCVTMSRAVYRKL